MTSHQQGKKKKLAANSQVMSECRIRKLERERCGKEREESYERHSLEKESRGRNNMS